MKIEAVFVDRDGTIAGNIPFIHPQNFFPYSFCRAAIQFLKDNNIKTFACTNQHRISRGEATLEDFHKEFQSYKFDDAFICPHSSGDDCNGHKPKPGMLLEASKFHLARVSQVKN
jgi:histidinol phosphatase-like enzyme